MKSRAYIWVTAVLASLLVSSAALADDFVYDKANRLAKTVSPNRVTTYAYDGEGNLTKECTGPSEAALTCSRIFVDAGELPRVLGKVTGSNETLYAYGPEGLAAQRGVNAGAAQAVEYALTDHQGTVRGLTDGAGSVQARTAYDAYGAVRSEAGPSASDIGYAGEYTGADGTVWLRARSYLPELGRFAQRDTYVFGGDTTQGLNRYVYAGNNPVNLTDPSGHGTYSALPNTLTEFWRGFQRGNRSSAGSDEPGNPCASEAEKWGEAAAGYFNSQMLNDDMNRFSRASGGRGSTRGGGGGTAGGSGRGPGSGRGGGAPCSFAAGTLVETREGLLPIDTLRPGDEVLSEDPTTGERSWKPVLGTSATSDEEVIKLRVRTRSGAVEAIETTANHPFYVRARGWVNAGDLSPGMDDVQGADGAWLSLDAAVSAARLDTMYNLDVADFDTFFVGRSRALVHNCNIQRGNNHTGLPENTILTRTGPSRAVVGRNIHGEDLISGAPVNSGRGYYVNAAGEQRSVRALSGSSFWRIDDNTTGPQTRAADGGIWAPTSARPGYVTTIDDVLRQGGTVFLDGHPDYFGGSYGPGSAVVVNMPDGRPLGAIPLTNTQQGH